MIQMHFAPNLSVKQGLREQYAILHPRTRFIQNSCYSLKPCCLDASLKDRSEHCQITGKTGLSTFDSQQARSAD